MTASNEREWRDPWLTGIEKRPKPFRLSVKPWLSVIALATQPALNAAISPSSIDKRLERMIEEDTIPTDEDIMLLIENQGFRDALAEVLDLKTGLEDIIGRLNEEGEGNGNSDEK